MEGKKFYPEPELEEKYDMLNSGVLGVEGAIGDMLHKSNVFSDYVDVLQDLLYDMKKELAEIEEELWRQEEEAIDQLRRESYTW